MTTRQPPGPAPTRCPRRWARWVELFASEQHAAKRSTNTIATRVGHLRAFALAHPRSDPLTVTRDQLVDYLAGNDWTPRTTHSVRSSLRVFFRLLHDLEHRRDDPARTLPTVKLPRALPRPCPDHVIVTAYSSTTDPRVTLAIRIATETGLRRGEVARLKPADVEGRPGNYCVHVVGKGGHERTVPISDELAAQLLSVTTAWVFPAPLGGPITPRHLGKLITRALPGPWTTHTLRHRFATVAYQTTSDLRAVQELLGHTSPVTTAIYTKVSDDSMRRAAMAAAVHRPTDSSGSIGPAVDDRAWGIRSHRDVRGYTIDSGDVSRIEREGHDVGDDVRFEWNEDGLQKLERQLQEQFSGGLNIPLEGSEDDAIRSVIDQLTAMGATPNEAAIAQKVREVRAAAPPGDV